MRETFSTLIQTSRDFCVDDKTSTQSGLSDTLTFIKREINRTVQFCHKKLESVHKTLALPKTMATVDTYQYYSYPPGINVIDTVTIDNDTIIPPLTIIQNQREWDLLNSGPAVSGIPSHIYMRARDFGLYPIPGDAYTLTLTGRYYPKNMTALDYTTGTVTVAQNSQTVTGDSTTFTSSMIGRYFTPTDNLGVSNGEFYKIGAYSSALVITLETYFEETSLAGATYLIGESPEIPEELHELIPYRVAGVYYGTRRRDGKKGQEYMNYFYTGDYGNNRRTGRIEGGLLGFIQNYAMKGSDNSQIIDMNQPVRHNWLAEEWNEVT